MMDAKNEGLEVVRVTQGGCNVTWTASKTLTPAGTALCSMPEALAAIAVRDARIAELEQSKKRIYSEMLEANNSFARMFQAGSIKLTEERDQLRAELARVAQTDAHYQTEALRLASELADTRDKMRAVVAECCEAQEELAAIKAQEPAAEVYETTKSAGSGDDEFYYFDISVRLLSKDLGKGDKLYAAPVAKQVVMPERLEVADEPYGDSDYPTYVKGHNDAIDKFTRLNAADQEGGV